MSNFRDVDRQTAFLLPPSVDEWLPERHLARFIVEVIDGLDLGGNNRAQPGPGSAAPPPRKLRGVFDFRQPTGNFFRPQAEARTPSSVACRYTASPPHPNQNTTPSPGRASSTQAGRGADRTGSSPPTRGGERQGPPGLHDDHSNPTPHTTPRCLPPRQEPGATASRRGGRPAAARGGGRGGSLPGGLTTPEVLSLHKNRPTNPAAPPTSEAQPPHRHEGQRRADQTKPDLPAPTTTPTRNPGGNPPAPPAPPPQGQQPKI